MVKMSAGSHQACLRAHPYILGSAFQHLWDSFGIVAATSLIEECHKKTEGVTTRKTKTAHIVEKIDHPSYTRKPQTELNNLSKQETKTLLIARFGMLECGKNYKGTMSEICSHCCCLDDEEHRLNVCPTYNHSNYSDSPDRIKFDRIYSDNIDDLKLIITRLTNVWNVKTGHGSMVAPS